MMDKNQISPFFKFDVLEWIEGRIELLDPEAKNRGVFVGLCARIWRNGGSIKNDEFLPSLLRMEKATFNQVLEFLKNNDFIVEKDGFLRVKFLDAQLTERFSYLEKQREIGKRGGRPRKPSKTLGLTNPFVDKTQQNPWVLERKVAKERKYTKKETSSLKKVSLRDDDNDGEKKAVVSNENRELQIVENLASAYPKKFGLMAGKRAALKVIRSEFDKGSDYDRIELDLTDDVKAYAETVAQWPEVQKRYIWSMETFFADGHYLDDRETWIRSDDENDNETPDVFRRLDAKR